MHIFGTVVYLIISFNVSTRKERSGYSCFHYFESVCAGHIFCCSYCNISEQTSLLKLLLVCFCVKLLNCCRQTVWNSAFSRGKEWRKVIWTKWMIVSKHNVNFLYYYFVAWLSPKNLSVLLIATMAFIAYTQQNCPEDLLKEWPQLWYDLIFI